MLTKPGERRRNLAILAGALAPDLSIFVLVAWARLAENMPHRQIWREAYWQEPWQTLGAISNSFPIWALIAFVAWRLNWHVAMFFSAAVLIHLALDFPVHADDAHRHFWPVSDWRFFSPLSYWDTRNHADWVRIVEIALVFASIAVLWCRFESWLVRGGLAVGVISLAAAPVFFWWTLG